MYDDAVQQQTLEAHGDLYRRHPEGFATLNVQEGRVELGSVVEAPFGPAFPFEPSRYTPLDEWSFESLEG
jgi:hypothetical protein